MPLKKMTIAATLVAVALGIPGLGAHDANTNAFHLFAANFPNTGNIV